MLYANNKGTDQPAHPRSLISTFVVRCLDRIIPILAKSKISRLCLASVAEHAGLSLTWSQTQKTGFDVAQLTCEHLPFRVLSGRIGQRHILMSRSTTKLTKWHVRHAKIQISLGINPVWSKSSLCAQWEAKDARFLRAESEDSDQTGRMPRPIWVFARRTGHFVGFVVRWLSLYFD